MHPNDLPADLLTVPEAARLLRCHVATVRRWFLRDKKLTAYRVGKRWLVSRADLLRAVERKGRAPVPRVCLATDAEVAAELAEFGIG